MNNIVAIFTAALTISVVLPVQATTVPVAQFKNNSIASGALGQAAMYYSCDDPLVQPFCKGDTLSITQNNAGPQSGFSFRSSSTTAITQAPSTSSSNPSDEDIVIDGRDIFIVDQRTAQQDILRTDFDLTTQPQLESTNVLTNPLPAAAPILFGGLAALGLLARRKRKAQAA